MQTEQPCSRNSQLTRREREVIGYLAEGWLAKEIADHLGIAISTVNKHLQNIYTKLQARNARQAISQFFPQKKIRRIAYRRRSASAIPEPHRPIHRKSVDAPCGVNAEYSNGVNS